MIGLGKGLLEQLLLRPNVIVIAAVRDPSSSQEILHKLSVGERSKLVVVKIDSSLESDAQFAVRRLKTDHNISKLDVVIANSGIAKHIGSVRETPIAEVRDHFEVNAIGPLTLFQATWPLLNTVLRPKFVIISSHAGSIGDTEHEPFEMLAYGVSKAAINFAVRRIHLSYSSLVAFPIHPGYDSFYFLQDCCACLLAPCSNALQMGKDGFRKRRSAALGMQEAAVSVHDSATGILSQVIAKLLVSSVLHAHGFCYTDRLSN